MSKTENVELTVLCLIEDGDKILLQNRVKKDWRGYALPGGHGFLHTDERGNLLGGAEYLPSMLVPYDIPHSEDAAFITCVYLSDAEYDYKSAPIKALEQYLRKTYARVFAVTDEKGVFPNGDLAFFTRNGYRDNGVIFEDQAYCKLHLVSKDLNE